MTPGALGGRRILVMEDEALIAMHVEYTLGKLGCSVLGPVKTVEKALALLEGNDLDAALLDVNLGGGSTSYPVAEALQQRHVPFAFLTGYGASGLRPDYRGRPVLSKPINADRLARVIAKLVSDRA